MLAVTVRAYPAALILLDTIHRVVSKVVLPSNLYDEKHQGPTVEEKEGAIKNLMSAWKSSVAGTGSTSSSNKGPPEIVPQPVPLFKNSPAGNFELPPYWSFAPSGLPQSQPPPPPPPLPQPSQPSQQQQSNEFSKG